MKSKLYIFSILAISILFIRCSKDPEPITDVNVFQGSFDNIEFPQSMKGWELYSWSNGDGWYYSMTPGSNSMKSLSFVTKSSIVVSGEDSLKELMTYLPVGENFIWLSDEWLEKMWEEGYEGFAMPSESIQNEIIEFCEDNGYIMEIAY